MKSTEPVRHGSTPIEAEEDLDLSLTAAASVESAGLSWKRAAASFLLLGLRPLAASAGDAELLPELKLRLAGARYLPSERDFRWVGWIGGAAGLLRAGKVTAFGSADVETIVGGERRAFDANQANYHLEVGVKRSVGKRELAVFFNHVSRHRQDRPKPEAVDWNTLGLRYTGSALAGPVPLRFELSAGHTTLASLVGYRFEAVAALEADVKSRARWGLSLRGRARGVTAEPNDALPRDGFVDLWLEAAGRIRRGSRNAEAFLAYEHRNDVYVAAPAVRDRGLLGIRFGLADR